MPKAPPSRCTQPGCTNLATNKGRCTNHQSSGWQDRRRHQDNRTTTQRLGISEHQWSELKTTIMGQHQGICYICGKPGATEVDHKLAVALGGAKTDPNNLAPIHAEPCHADKTKRELAVLRRLSNARHNDPNAGRI